MPTKYQKASLGGNFSYNATMLKERKTVSGIIININKIPFAEDNPLADEELGVCLTPADPASRLLLEPLPKIRNLVSRKKKKQGW